MNDGYLFYWQSFAILDASGERFPILEQSRWRRWYLLYEKFPVFSYRTSEQSYIALLNVS